MMSSLGLESGLGLELGLELGLWLGIGFRFESLFGFRDECYRVRVAGLGLQG